MTTHHASTPKAAPPVTAVATKHLSKEERRALMPFTASIVDAYRDAFGELAAIKASENGINIEWRK